MFWGTEEERIYPSGWNGGELDLASVNGRLRGLRKTEDLGFRSLS